MDMKIDIILQKILHKITTGLVDSKAKIESETIQLDFSTKAEIKHEYISDGKILLVHDVPIAKEMVQTYSDGVHYKTAEAIDGINTEYSPISIQHPSMLFNEMGDAERIDRIVGYTNGGHTKDNKKYTDMYFFVSDKTKRIQDDVKAGNTIDVSIGFNVQYDHTPGTFEGKHYDVKQTQINLDHTAVLPDATGRASFPDGIGMGADSIKNKQGGDKMPEKDIVDAFKQVGELQKEIGDSKAKVSDLQKEVDAKTEEIKTLQDEAKKVDEYKKKAEQFDKSKKLSDEAEKTKCDDLKEKIIKVNSDEKTVKFIEGMDSDHLQFVLDEATSSSKGLPARSDKKDKADTGEHPADVKFKERYEKQTGVKL